MKPTNLGISLTFEHKPSIFELESHINHPFFGYPHGLGKPHGSSRPVRGARIRSPLRWTAARSAGAPRPGRRTRLGRAFGRGTQGLEGENHEKVMEKPWG